MINRSQKLKMKEAEGIRMRMKIKKIFVMLLSIAMIITGFVGSDLRVKAATDDHIYATDTTAQVVTPGTVTHVKIPVKTDLVNLTVDSIVVSAGQDAFTITNIGLYVGSSKINVMYNSTVYTLEFDVLTDESAVIKNYPVSFLVSGTSYNPDEAAQDINFSTTLKVVEERTPVQLTVSEVALDSTDIGSGTNLSFTVKNEGEITAKSVYLTMDYGTVMDSNYTAKNIKIGDLAAGATKSITLPVTILGTAAVGKNPLTANFTYKSSGGTALTSAYKFYVNLTSGESSPSLAITNMSYGDSLKPGEDFTLVVSLKNNGAATAVDVCADIDAASITQDGIIKNYYSDVIEVSSIAKGRSAKALIPLTVSKYATGGMKNLKVLITYLDSLGNQYTVSKNVYVDVSAATSAGSPNIVITNVVQSPSQPQAGDKVTITFELENKSKVDATDLKIYPDALSNASFIPVDADPYQYIDKLEGGAKKKISVPLIVSTGIPEGLNNLTMKYSYTGGEGSAIIPVRNIKNSMGSSSIPKLIISKYTTDVEELKAGSTFNLTFDIYNTNSSVAAKNISITITQADNIFTVTQGSNSFFINHMDPGETVENTIQMKVKSDATTKAYPLTLTIEYEYDGEKPNTETGEVGMKKIETLNLNAEENARPVVDGINVSSWNGPVMSGTAATLSFNFYNMGKAVLNNVSATVEGDGFTPTSGMLFIGNVEAGSSAYEEIEVMPNSEGTVSGTLKISYEDSNGETIDFTKDFQADVMPAATVDPGAVDGGAGPVMNPDVPMAKKDILPIWAFVLIQIAIFVIFVPVTRKVIISGYKAKLRKNEREQY